MLKKLGKMKEILQGAIETAEDEGATDAWWYAEARSIIDSKPEVTEALFKKMVQKSLDAAMITPSGDWDGDIVVKAYFPVFSTLFIPKEMWNRVAESKDERQIRPEFVQEVMEKIAKGIQRIFDDMLLKELVEFITQRTNNIYLSVLVYGVTTRKTSQQDFIINVSSDEKYPTIQIISNYLAVI